VFDPIQFWFRISILQKHPQAFAEFLVKTYKKTQPILMVICFIRVPEGETVIALTKSIEDRGQSKQKGLEKLTFINAVKSCSRGFAVRIIKTECQVVIFAGIYRNIETKGVRREQSGGIDGKGLADKFCAATTGKAVNVIIVFGMKLSYCQDQFFIKNSLLPPQLSQGGTITGRNSKIIGIPGGADFIGKLRYSSICQIVATLKKIPKRTLAKGWMINQVPLPKKG
jgi:hypothetical protein